MKPTPKVSFERVSPVEAKVSVEVPAERVADALERAYRGLARRVRIKGFRPGHVPRHILERHYRERVEAEVRDLLIEETFGEAMAEQRVRMVSSPAFRKEELAPGKPLKYQARFEVRPDIEPRIDLQVPKPAVEVKPEEIEQELEAMRQSLAQLVPVERTRVEAGDLAQVSFSGQVPGEEVKIRSDDLLVEVAEGRFVDGKVAALAGVSVGEETEIPVLFPDDFNEAALRGKTVPITFQVKAIKRRDVPGLDDELARDLGQADLAALRAEAERRVRARVEARVESDHRNQVVRALLDRNPVDAPPGLVERMVEARLEDLDRQLQRAGGRLGHADAERLRPELRMAIQDEVRTTLLLDAIAEREDISVGDDEIETHLVSLALAAGERPEKARARLGDERVRDALRDRLRRDKTLAFLASRAQTQTEPA